MARPPLGPRWSRNSAPARPGDLLAPSILRSAGSQQVLPPGARPCAPAPSPPPPGRRSPTSGLPVTRPPPFPTLAPPAPLRTNLTDPAPSPIPQAPPPDPRPPPPGPSSKAPPRSSSPAPAPSSPALQPPQIPRSSERRPQPSPAPFQPGRGCFRSESSATSTRASSPPARPPASSLFSPPPPLLPTRKWICSHRSQRPRTKWRRGKTEEGAGSGDTLRAGAAGEPAPGGARRGGRGGCCLHLGKVA